MTLDGVTSFVRLKDVTNTCKCMRHSPAIGGNYSVQWWKVGRSWRLQMCFPRLFSVRIEIDQLYCVNCWVIIHCVSVSCMKINHLRCTLVICSSLQLTSKQWIITQQFTARADLFHKQVSMVIDTDWVCFECLNCLYLILLYFSLTVQCVHVGLLIGMLL